MNRRNLMRWLAGLICGLSFTVGLFIGIPDDEDKGIIDYGRNLG